MGTESRLHGVRFAQVGLVRSTQGLRATLGELASGPFALGYLGLLGFCLAGTTYLIPAQVPMALAAAAVLSTAILKGKGLRVGGPPGQSLVIFWVFLTLSVPTSIWLGESVLATQEMARMAVIYLVAVNTLTTRNRILWLMGLVLILLAVFPALGAITGYLAGQTKVDGRAGWDGVFGNPNSLALIVLMHVPFAIAFASLRRATWWRVMWALFAVVFVTTAVLTKSRAAFVALGGLGVGAVALTRHRGRALATATTVGIAVVLLAPQDFRDRMSTIIPADGPRDASAGHRVIIWKTAAQIALTHPLTGIGVGTFEMAVSELAPAELGTSGGDRWVDTHNTYLKIWAEIGTPGLIAFVTALVLLLTRGWRTLRRLHPKDPLAMMLRAAITSTIVFCIMGVFNSFHNIFYFYLVFAIAMAIIQIEGLESKTVPVPSRNRVRASVLRGGLPATPVFMAPPRNKRPLQ